MAHFRRRPKRGTPPHYDTGDETTPSERKYTKKPKNPTKAPRDKPTKTTKKGRTTQPSKPKPSCPGGKCRPCGGDICDEPCEGGICEDPPCGSCANCEPCWSVPPLPNANKVTCPPVGWAIWCGGNTKICQQIIDASLKNPRIRDRLFTNLPKPTVPPKEKKFIKKKCHQVPECVKKALARFEKRLMREELLERTGLMRSGENKTKKYLQIAGIVCAVIFLILMAVLFYCYCMDGPVGKKRKGKSGKTGSKKGSAKSTKRSGKSFKSRKSKKSQKKSKKSKKSLKSKRSGRSKPKSKSSGRKK